MLVYGDPSTTVSARLLLDEVQLRASRADPDSLDDLRSLLVRAGQLEQGIEDQEPSAPPATATGVRDLTDLAAGMFCTRWLDRNRSKASLESFEKRLRSIAPGENQLLTLKIPEGFEFYALFPEQYAASALAWCRRNPSAEGVLVVGIRSIGTTLSAVVKAILCRTIPNIERLTVRPAGRPFDRQTRLPPLHTPALKHAIVVDEGPGLSGSSMAGAVKALRARGFESITLFPGHEHEPGPNASPEIRTIWNQTPRIVTPLTAVRWERCSLPEALEDRAARLLSGPQPANFIQGHALKSLFRAPDPAPADGWGCQDCSGGLWRRQAYRLESEWPAVAAQFERMKFRCSDSQGNSVLWKFCGFGAQADAARKRMARLADQGFTPPPLCMKHGFLAMRWLDGVRLTVADGVDERLLNRIGQYLAASAEPGLNRLETRDSMSRLESMLHANTREALGVAAADEAISARPSQDPLLPLAAGDGHLGPWEWVLTADSTVLKVDCEGHSSDHTLVGRQPFYWDIAAALTEWDLDWQAAPALLEPVESAGLELDRDALRFYELAFAAFRMGLMSLAMQQTSDPADRARLQAAFYFYQNRLRRRLKGAEAALPSGHSGMSHAPPNHQSQARSPMPG